MFKDYFCAYCTLVFANRPSHAVFPSFPTENPPCFVVFRSPHSPRTRSAASCLTNSPGCRAKISPLKNEKAGGSKISGKEILEAIRLMDADKRRERTRALFA